MNQLDWIGEKKQKAFKDIRNTRDSVAEEKARLALQLGELCNKCPERLKSGGSVQDVRTWKLAREEAMKVAGNRRASVHELTSAINKMRRFA